MKELAIHCQNDQRREQVRHHRDPQGRRDLNGLDYLEVSEDQHELKVYFLGKLPQTLREDKDALNKLFRIEGGRRITNIRVTDVEPHHNDNPERDDYLLVRVDKPGDFSTYKLRIVGVRGIDPRYDHIDFSFKAGCVSDLDCAPQPICPPLVRSQPEINYLAKDYASFRQLILDRLALIMPAWKERHVPDLGVALVELLAYVGDHLSYYQDAVATEAYLDTARQRISVRRHARLVDYYLHEGCNARAWVCIETDRDLNLHLDRVQFITGLNDSVAVRKTILSEADLRELPSGSYELFEPMMGAPGLRQTASERTRIQLRRAHSEIKFYTWGEHECCLPKGATRATLQDAWLVDTPAPADSLADKRPHKSDDSPPRPARALQLQAGDVLIFEERIGPKTGEPADANPLHRQAVRLTRVEPGEDAIYPQRINGIALPTPVVEIAWADEDALRFPLCLSAIGRAPKCEYCENISVACGNVILVDHGRTLRPAEPSGPVPLLREEAQCDCAEHPSEVVFVAGRFAPKLKRTPLTFAQPLPADGSTHEPYASASALIQQTAHGARPQVRLQSVPAHPTTQPFTPLFKLSDVDDPTELIEAMRDRANLRAHAVRQRLSPQTKRQLAKLKPKQAPSATLLLRVSQDLRAMLSNWESRYDLLSSGPDEQHFVVETDNDGMAHLRFGNDEMGELPDAGATFYATYRIGNGVSGNVGAEAISHLVLRETLSGVHLRVRNPLPASGGVAAEPLSEAKLYAPTAFRKRMERAVIANDYARLAERNRKVQRAAATLNWTGSWYEADVAIDPWGGETSDELLERIVADLHPYRRIGHDLHVVQAKRVPLDIALKVCVKSGFLRGHVKAALLAVFSNRILPDGTLGFFHPDALSVGEGVYLSKLVATAARVVGVESVQVTRLQRLYEAPNQEIEQGVLLLGPLEVAQLDGDPSFPEHGLLTLDMQGGR